MVLFGREYSEVLAYPIHSWSEALCDAGFLLFLNPENYKRGLPTKAALAQKVVHLILAMCSQVLALCLSVQNAISSEHSTGFTKFILLW
jgi:hypothetical protein